MMEEIGFDTHGHGGVKSKFPYNNSLGNYRGHPDFRGFLAGNQRIQFLHKK